MAKGKNKAVITNIKDTFKVVRLSALVSNYTDINPKGGIYNSFNANSEKCRKLKKEEKEKLSKALKNLANELILIACSDELTGKEDDKV